MLQRLSHLLWAVMGGFTLLLLSQILLLQPPYLRASSYFIHNLVSRLDGGDSEPQANLAVTISVTPNKPLYGQLITYSIVVINQGPDKATWVQISDHLPIEVTYQGSSASQGAYSSTVGLWDVGTLPNQAAATLLVTALVNTCPSDGSPLLNTASRVQSEPFDPTPDDDTSEAAVTVICADLAITETVHPQTRLTTGSTLDFLITVTNRGPHTATGVTITGTLPNLVRYLSHTLTRSHTYSDTAWTLHDPLPEGENAVLRIRARVNCSVSGNEPTLSVVAVKGFEPDLDVENNVDNAGVNVEPGSSCRVYLPVVFKNYCSSNSIYHLDSFDDPNSGWLTAINLYIEADYSYIISPTEKYRIYSKQEKTFPTAFSISPLGSFKNYTINVEANTETPLSDEYGIIFGVVNKDSPRVRSADSFYRFVINTRNEREYSLRRFDGNDWYPIVDWVTNNTSINGNTTVNLLQVTCFGSHAAIFTNNNLLWDGDLPSSCRGEVGLTSSIAWPQTKTESRFDDFEICGQPDLVSSSRIAHSGRTIPNDVKSRPKD